MFHYAYNYKNEGIAETRERLLMHKILPSPEEIQKNITNGFHIISAALL
jgi:hypothetical protein